MLIFQLKNGTLTYKTLLGMASQKANQEGSHSLAGVTQQTNKKK